jgi:CheY-like chemotaxis protein
MSRILVIDDELSIRLALRSMLQRGGAIRSSTLRTAEKGWRSGVGSRSTSW